ncbi:MAG: threonine synthase, partial [Betaproteobacteria bacterium]|nr:threonine synthase [Betaproteobacteria bacterium]
MTLAYRSTRSEARLGSFTDILLEGLSPDGGLAVPEHLPQLKPGQLQEWAQLPYPELAAQVMALYADDLGVSVLRPLAARAYSSEKFGDHRITPLHVLGVEGGAPLGLLSLSNGPTLAFKDLAMQMLGELFEYVLSAQGRTLNILGATSG